MSSNGAAGGSAGGGKLYQDRIGPGNWPWRAVDFWRQGLLPDKTNEIRSWNRRHLKKEDKEARYDQCDMEGIEKAKMIPFGFFVDLSARNEEEYWMWSVKEDGMFVKLIRDSKTDMWSMRTRRNIPLYPPLSFLEGLNISKGLPSVMYGELVTCFAGCPKDDRKHTERRNLLRNQQFKMIQFAKLGNINSDPQYWVGLRVKIFAFPRVRPDKNYTTNFRMSNLFELYGDAMLKTLDLHPHIGMCNSGILRSTQDAIDIFKSVVQMGLEGIVIVNPESEYGGLLDHAGDDACNYFKLKQKIVRPGEELRATGRIIDKIKDGVLQREHQYTINIDKKLVFFTDQQERDSCAYVRIKYMERAPLMYDTFPCQSGYRHMHFATQHDMSVEVPAAEELTHEALVRQVLGVDDGAATRSAQLFNPRPFALDSAPDSAERPGPEPEKRPRPGTSR
jgi:hypothetical protein